MLLAATYHVRLAGGDQAAVVYSSVSVAFITYIAIIFYHVYQLASDGVTSLEELYPSPPPPAETEGKEKIGKVLQSKWVRIPLNHLQQIK